MVSVAVPGCEDTFPGWEILVLLSVLLPSDCPGATRLTLEVTRLCSFNVIEACGDSRLTFPFPVLLLSVALLLPAVILLAFAVLPGQLLSPLGALCAPFFGQEAIGGEIAYFSGENLMGAVKSIAIGVVVYFLVVRLLLMAKDEKGVRVYVNRWPEKLDLEDLVYRPVLLKLLPGVCTLVVRFVAELPETVVVFLRDTIFSKRKKHRPVPVGNRFTYACGKAVNGVAMALNATFLKSHPVRTDFEYVFDASWKEFIAGTHLITRSVSFGLLLLCIGLYITCAYLMMH